MSVHRDDYRNPRLASATRADLLVREMTLTEKCWQLTPVPPWWISLGDGTDPADLATVLAKAPRHVCNFGVDNPAHLAEVVGRNRTGTTRVLISADRTFLSHATITTLTDAHMP